MKKSDSLNYELSKGKLIILFIYFSLILLGGISCSVFVILHLLQGQTPANRLLCYTIVASFSVSSMLCSMQYIKRLYKACITDRIIHSETRFGEIGNLFYFLLRPIYALSFTIVMIFALLSGMFIVTGSLDYIINEKFLYLCALLSSFIGYSTGHLLDKFEAISRKEIDKI